MTDSILDLLDLPRAAVDADAPLADAAKEIYDGVGAVAILDGDRVVGMLDQDDLIRALFPAYLGDVSHTAFVETDEWIAPHFERLASARVSEFMGEAEIVELPTSALDVAQRFLHTDASALVATRDGRFAGVIEQRAFCKALLQRYGWES